MKKILLLVIAAGAIWWYITPDQPLTEEAVYEFYQQQEHQLLSRNPAGLCALLAPEFEGVLNSPAGSRTEDRDSACEAYQAMFDGFAALGEKMGGLLQLDSRYTIHSIQLVDEGKLAIVDVSYALDVAGSIMNIRSRSTETIIKRRGKPLLLRSTENRQP